MFYLTIVNNTLRHCHSWLARQLSLYLKETAALSTSQSEMDAFIQTSNLSQTRSKSDNKYESLAIGKLEILTFYSSGAAFLTI